MQNTKQKLIVFPKEGVSNQNFLTDNGVSVHLGLGLLLFFCNGAAKSVELSSLHSFDVVTAE